MLSLSSKESVMRFVKCMKPNETVPTTLIQSLMTFSKPAVLEECYFQFGIAARKKSKTKLYSTFVKYANCWFYVGDYRLRGGKRDFIINGYEYYAQGDMQGYIYGSIWFINGHSHEFWFRAFNDDTDLSDNVLTSIDYGYLNPLVDKNWNKIQRYLIKHCVPKTKNKEIA